MDKSQEARLEIIGQWREWLRPDVLALIVASFAAVLALAPYVLPQVQVMLIRQGLVKHPELLQETVEAYRLQQIKAQQVKFQESVKANAAVLITPQDPVIGNPKAPVTIVEFQDYYCGYCRAMAPDVEAILAVHPDVRLVVKEYPVIGPNSPMLSALALAARNGGHYGALHHAFFASSLKTEADIKAAISTAGLDYANLAKIADSPDIRDQISKNLVLGSQLGINGTPFFVINGQVVNGASAPELRNKVDEALKATK